MILVDNFRTVLLVGLICTGISPAFGGANSCKGDAGDQQCSPDDSECLFNELAKPAGCVPPASCPGGGPSNGAKCGGGKCCCTADAEPCNDPGKEPLKSEICKDATLAESLGITCNGAPGAPTTTPPTTGGGGGGGGGDGGGGFLSVACKAKGQDSINCETGKACVSKVVGDDLKVKLECWEKSKCQQEGCSGSDVCCCYVEDKGCEVEIPSSAKSSGSIIFGSFQVVTLVATTLYFSQSRSLPKFFYLSS